MDQHPLARLRRYDANAIAQYYRFRPWLLVWRTLCIILPFLSFVLGLKLDQWQHQENPNKLKRATQLRRILTSLGPTYIKVGQALSTRPDLVRKDFLDELVKLQDQLPPFPNPIAFNIIESQLDRTIDEVYSQISPDPVAAASLAQVYRARLHSGEEVAVKVQRPGTRARIEADLDQAFFVLQSPKNGITWVSSRPLVPARRSASRATIA